MAQSAATQITCPNCQQPFRAILEQLLNVDSDPSAKERLLSGRVNLVACPHCGFRGAIATPLLYHDNKNELAITYVPVELGLQKVEEEQIIGSMTRYLMQTLPEDAPKGYLLNPKPVLTMQGMIDLILEADGITPEMIEDQQRKIELVEAMANASPEELDILIEDNIEMFDAVFFEIISAAAQAASQAGDGQVSLRLLNARSRLLETTDVGQAIKAQQEAIEEAAQELRAMGETISRQEFLEVLINAAHNPIKVAALASMARPLVDYTLFQMITDRIKATDDPEEKELLASLREELLEISAAFEQQARAVVGQAVETLKAFLSAPNLPAVVRANASRIDETFLQVLQSNLEEARRSGQLDVYTRLKEIRDEVLKVFQEASPPELRFINELMSIEDENEALAVLRERANEINENVIALLDEIIGHFQEAENEEAVRRVALLREEAAALIGS